MKCVDMRVFELEMPLIARMSFSLFVEGRCSRRKIHSS